VPTHQEEPWESDRRAAEDLARRRSRRGRVVSTRSSTVTTSVRRWSFGFVLESVVLVLVLGACVWVLLVVARSFGLVI
jgi:hypothetical protein